MLDIPVEVLKTWEYKKQKVSVQWKEHRPIFVVEDKDAQQKSIQNFNVTGIPSEVKKDPAELKAFLEQTFISLNESSNGDLKLIVSPQLLGGGNIINPQTESRKLWPGGLIPFEIDSRKYPVAKEGRALILEAIKEFNALNTGFKLIPKTDQSDYLIFGEEEGKCYSHVGRQGGAQYIRCDLDGGGFNKRSVKHEIMHAIGFYHEHQRFDRDEYVVVNARNQANYGKEGNAYKSYDFNSIMHYYFAEDLQPRRGRIARGAENVGMQDSLSTEDIEAAQYLARYARAQHFLRPRHIESTPIVHPQRIGDGMLLWPILIPEHQKLRARAERLFKSEQYAEAYDVYATLISEYHTAAHKKTVSKWLNKCGVCANRLGQYDIAKEDFENAIELNPKNEIAKRNCSRNQEAMNATSFCPVM